MLTPAPFFYFPLQAFSQNAQPSLEEGMIFFWGGWETPTSENTAGRTQTLLATIIPNLVWQTVHYACPGYRADLLQSAAQTGHPGSGCRQCGDALPR